MPTTITIADLRALRACGEQATIFDATFPHGVTVTPDNYRAVATAAAAAGLDVQWYAERALTPAERDTYCTAVAQARDTYRAAVDPALAAYEDVKAHARAAYRVSEAAYSAAAYEEATAQAGATYDEAVTQARAAYRTAVAEALCAILAARSIPDADA